MRRTCTTTIPTITEVEVTVLSKITEIFERGVAGYGGGKRDFSYGGFVFVSQEKKKRKMGGKLCFVFLLFVLTVHGKSSFSFCAFLLFSVLVLCTVVTCHFLTRKILGSLRCVWNPSSRIGNGLRVHNFDA